MLQQENWYPAKGEANVKGRFDHMEVLDPAASEAKGELVNKKIIVLMEKSNLSPDWNPKKLPADPIARKAMIDRYPEAWLAFQGEEVKVPGTPLETNFHELTMTRSEVLKYNLAGITAWEEIADLSDAGCQHVGFGTVKRREEVMRAMGRTPPGKPPNIQLSANMTAEQALLSMDGGKELVERLNKMIAAHDSGEAPLAQVSQTVPVMPDLTHPMVQAAIQAAVQAALANPAGAPVPAPAAVSSTASDEPETPAQAAPVASAGEKRGGWPKGYRKGPDGKPVPPDAEAA